MDLINEAEIRDTWSPIIESATGITESAKLGWMSQYCHNHKLYEEANIMSLNPMNLHGMGAASVGTTNHATSQGSGDKAPSLLPLAMQVAAQTIGLDLVPVVPMAGPMGLLSYLDFTYQGGNLTTKSAPTYVKCTLAFENSSDKTSYLTGAHSSRALAAGTEATADYAATATASSAGDSTITATVTGAFLNWPATGFVVNATHIIQYTSINAAGTIMTLANALNAGGSTMNSAQLNANVTLSHSFDSTIGAATAGISTSYNYHGVSRIDGKHIFEVVGDIVQATVTTDLHYAAEANDLLAGASAIELVTALNDHIADATGAAPTTDGVSNPYERNVGESTPDKIMGLTLFSKTIAAKTFQVAAAVTREQVQDLKQFGVDAVAQVETVLTNELTQSINSLILNKINTLGTSNLTKSGLAASFNLDLSTTPGGGSTPASQNRRLLTLILSAANLIANRGRRGAGNFAVVSGLVASLLQSVAGYTPAPISNTLNQNAGGIYPVGSVAGVTVYTDPNVSFSSLVISVGRKGDGNGAGLVFMPYLMAESVQTIAEGTMAPKVAVKSRFALVEAGHNPETQYLTFAPTSLTM